jgi:MoaA/NifB/PqqE/SkfB family radical SAM enzyme
MATPALYSKPMGNFLSRQIYRTIQNRNIPNLFSFAINDDCNAFCEHCSFFQGVSEKGREVVNTRQAIKIIQDAQELGVSIINIVGGEPTLRKDLTEIIQSVDKDLSTVIMFTNGSLLSEMATRLKGAGLDGVYISIDSADPKRHDSIRKHPGLFSKALRGLEEAKKAGLTTGISVVITPESFKEGELENMIELGKKLGVHEVIVFDSMPTGRYAFRKDLIDNHEWVEDLIKSVKKYNEDPTYPGVLVYAYTTSFRSVGCSCGTSYFYISPYGDMMSCDFNHAKFGNVLEEPLYKVWGALTNKPEFKSAKWGGCKIKDSEYLKKDTVCSNKACSGV